MKLEPLRRLAEVVALALCQTLALACAPPPLDFDGADAGTSQAGTGGSGAGGEGGDLDPTCRDRLQNQDETDVDCGGSFCNFCAAGKHCESGNDCEDGVCTNGQCREHSCSDGVLNGLESEVDCGEGCGPCGSGGGGGGGAGSGGEGGVPVVECAANGDCDDSNPCTDDVCVDSTCQTIENTRPCASDGIACTADVCAAGSCTHEPDDTCACNVDGDCDDGNVCTDETCVEHACAPTNNANPCASDNIACTVDVCSAGSCAHQPDGSCQCLADGDCDDSNACTDDACVDYACEILNNNDPCGTDGIDCTTDVCSDGSCGHQPDASCECLIAGDCDDTNICTDDACVGFACQNSNNSAPCGSDGIACTDDVCSDGSCGHAPTASCECLIDTHCNDGIACTDDTCVDYACVTTDNADPCTDDGIACTTDVCSGGSCTHQSQSCGCNLDTDCDDSNPCTDQACVAFSCQITNNTDPCSSDGIACTTDVCSAGTCTHAPTAACECLIAAHCDDSNPCTDDTCTDYACGTSNNTAACASDGIACTTDVCSAGSCNHNPTGSCECLVDIDCDDGSVCTDDACFDYACDRPNNTAACASDGIACTDDVCAAGSCTHSPTASCECISGANCDDGNTCTDDACTNYACDYSNNTAGCASDGIACTTDACSAGGCDHNPTGSCECTLPGDCDDTNVCTDNTCVDYACDYPNNTAPCMSDGVSCTTDVCSGGSCAHNPTGSCQCATAGDCNDGNPCTSDACTNFACEYTNNTASCASDGNECTDDVCSAGACTHPARSGSCTDDGDTCTADQCSAGACTHADTGLCAASNFVVIRSNRDSNYVVVEDSPSFALDRYILGTGASMGSVTMSWDATNLYFYFAVTDNTPFGDSVNHWQDDSVEIYLDTNNGKTATYEADDQQITIARSNTAIQGNNTADTAAIGVVRTSNAAGYTLDVTIPWSAINVSSPPLGGEIGIDFGVNDDTNGGDSREAQLMVFGTDLNHQNTSAFGTITLSAGALLWTGATQAEGAVFEKVGEIGERFTLRDQASGRYVGLSSSDALVLVYDELDATVFEAETCDSPYVGLRAVHDVDGSDYVVADAGDELTASTADCGAGNAGSWQKFELIPVTQGCAVPADCDDTNPCTNDTCVANFCSYTDNSAACVSDGDPCTQDQCISGTCTHLQTGSCAGTLLAIFANHFGRYIVLNGIFLENTGLNIAAAEAFERVDSAGSLFRLRAESTGNFVRLDVNDELTADGTFGQATVFDSFDCAAPMVALEATTDNDNDRTIAAEDSNRLKARSPNCNFPGATSWEKFRLYPL